MDQTLNQQVNKQRREEQDKSSKMIKLLENPLFQELVVEDFIRQGIVEQTLQNSLDNPKTVDELKARQLLNKYIFAIITSGEIANSH